jgi:Serine dehydrogenase proteinase
VTDKEQAAPGWLDTLLQMRQRRIELISKLEKMRGSKVFVFWNLDELRYDDFLSLAELLDDEPPVRDIDLVLMSNGGNGEAGYRIGHAFQQLAQAKGLRFRVIIPLYARSAATILALGAHEIVMGLHSEIGPIDPQVPKFDPAWNRTRYMPAMALSDGIKLVCEFMKQLPAMSSFFEDLLRKRLSLDELGELERVRESGKQYAELLLLNGMAPDPRTARAIAERLSDYYKFHGHPIDVFDAEDMGLKVVRSSGEEWQAIKQLRDEFQDFAGRPDRVPGLIVASMVESALRRSWRYVALDSETPPAVQ